MNVRHDKAARAAPLFLALALLTCDRTEPPKPPAEVQTPARKAIEIPEAVRRHIEQRSPAAAGSHEVQFLEVLSDDGLHACVDVTVKLLDGAKVAGQENRYLSLVKTGADWGVERDLERDLAGVPEREILERLGKRLADTLRTDIQLQAGMPRSTAVTRKLGDQELYGHITLEFRFEDGEYQYVETLRFTGGTWKLIDAQLVRRK